MRRTRTFLEKTKYEGKKSTQRSVVGEDDFFCAV
jgi:hypothetical protein